ncbi:lipopolysaccharide biosynthesis protein [Serratia fonticola]|uniref:lipopolysaccharide biosynthesis protein n=1 Tax=Serratia fonticola TaxID=47917 RepID=UPI001647671B|nr:hypothetical protein [Serratia fonticola]MBC3229582.1 hypothetical protein [Serratia fonticola]
MYKKLFGFSGITVFASILGFLLLPLVTKVLQVDAFGEYSLYYSISVVLASVFLFGTPSSYSLVFAEKSEERIKKVQDVFSFFITCNTISFISLQFLVIILVVFYDFSAALFFIPLLIISRSIYQVVSQYMRLENKVIYFAFYQCITISLSFIVPLLTAYFFIVTGLQFIAVMSFVFFISSIVGLCYLHNKGQSCCFDFFYINSSLLHFGIFSAAHALTASMITVSDRFILAGYMERGEFAIYSLAALLASTLSLVYSAISQNLSPILYKKLKDGMSFKLLLLTYGIKYLSFVLVLFLLYQLLISVVVLNFFPQAYAGAINISRLLVVGVLFQGGYFLFSSLIMYLRATNKLFMITLVCGLFNVTFGLLMCKYFGLKGVVLSYLLTWFIFMLSTFFVCKRGFYAETN